MQKQILGGIFVLALAAFSGYLALTSRSQAPTPATGPNAASPATGDASSNTYAFAFTDSSDFKVHFPEIACQEFCLAGHFPEGKTVRLLIAGGVSCMAQTDKALEAKLAYTPLTKVDGCSPMDAGRDLAIAVLDPAPADEFKWLAVEETQTQVEGILKADSEAAKIVAEFAAASTLPGTPTPKIVAVEMKAGDLNFAQARVEDPNSKKSLTLGPTFAVVDRQPRLLTQRDHLCTHLKGAFRLGGKTFVLTTGGTCDMSTFANTHSLFRWDGKAWNQIATLAETVAQP